MNAIIIVLPILSLLMFELGLTLQVSDFKLLMHRPKPVLVALFGQIVLLPAVALLLAKLFHLPPVFFVGLVLIACCPGGSSSNVFSMLARGDVALSVSLTALSSVITLFTLPIIMDWTVIATGANATANIHLPVGNLLMQNLVLMFVPIIIGLLVRRFAAATALRIERVLKKLAFPLLMLLAVIYFIQQKEAILDNFTTLGIVVTLLLLCTTGLAALLCRIFRLVEKERRTIVIEVGMQNAAQAIAVASSPFIFNNAAIAAPAIVYALMMNVVLLIYVGSILYFKK